MTKLKVKIMMTSETKESSEVENQIASFVKFWKIGILAKNKQFEIMSRLPDSVLILFRYDNKFYSRSHSSLSTKDSDKEQEYKESKKKAWGGKYVIEGNGCWSYRLTRRNEI